MNPGLLLGALAQFAAVAVLGWIVADVILRVAGGRLARLTSTGLPEGIALPERALLSIAGFVTLSVAFAVINILTGGALFGIPWVVPASSIVVIALGFRRHRLPRGVPWLAVLCFAALLVAIYESPILFEGSGVRAGDSTLHMGWTEQLLGGEPVPTGPAPEFARNAYPWGFHATMATMVRLVPGTTPLVAQEALELVILFGLPLAAACLARRIRTGSGWPGAAAIAFIGGFGWVAARGWSFDASPTEARFGADLVVASPNSVYELFPPAFPRELGLVLLGAAGLLLVLAVRTEDHRMGALAGGVSGLVGLVSIPLLVSAILWIVVGAVLAGSGARLRMLLAAATPALMLPALWAVPLLANYLRYGGFVNVTATLGREWPFPVALAAWGILTPLAIAGVVLAFRSGTSSARVLLGFAAVTALMLVAAVLHLSDWITPNNETLLHPGRVWPVAHLLGAAFGGVAIAALLEWLRQRSRTLVVAVAGALLLVGIASPVLAAGGLRRIMADHSKGFIFESGNFSDESLVMRAAGVLGPDDTVQAPPDLDANVLGLWMFQFSGARVIGHRDPRYEGNELRIRYEELAESYRKKAESGGFDPDYKIVPAVAGGEGVEDSEVAARGEFQGEEWLLIRSPDDRE